MVTLVVVDHHQSDFVDRAKVDLPLFSSEEECIRAVKDAIEKDYDFILSDADPDGYISAMLYFLNRKKNVADNYRCFRVPLTKELIAILEKNNIHSILAFDWFPLYGCDFSLFEKVTLINPRFSHLFENTSASELVYRACGQKTSFLRDLNAIGVVSDYGMTSGVHTVTDTILAYPDLFRSLQDVAKQGRLNRYNVFDSPFKELSEMFWSPYIMKGEEGVHELVHAVIEQSPFTYADLFDFVHHPTVKLLRRHWYTFQLLLRRERELFNQRKQEQQNVITYAPQTSSPGFIQKFSSMLVHDYMGKVVLLKIKINNRTKYSARQRGLLLDLGKIFQEMGVGGGHPEAAGAIVDDPVAFEQAFIDRVAHELQL